MRVQKEIQFSLPKLICKRLFFSLSRTSEIWDCEESELGLLAELKFSDFISGQFCRFYRKKLFSGEFSGELQLEGFVH
ncbi:hypothetical protein Pfo_002391, partial [Paulownia fortunei]